MVPADPLDTEKKVTSGHSGSNGILRILKENGEWMKLVITNMSRRMAVRNRLCELLEMRVIPKVEQRGARKKKVFSAWKGCWFVAPRSGMAKNVKYFYSWSSDCGGFSQIRIKTKVMKVLRAINALELPQQTGKYIKVNMCQTHAFCCSCF